MCLAETVLVEGCVRKLADRTRGHLLVPRTQVARVLLDRSREVHVTRVVDDLHGCRDA
jgi:hypothetical protein